MQAKKTFASARATVPAAFVALQRGYDFESTLGAAVMFNGDTDTVAGMAGSMAEPLYGIPEPIAARAVNCLDDWMAGVLAQFQRRFRDTP